MDTVVLHLDFVYSHFVISTPDTGIEHHRYTTSVGFVNLAHVLHGYKSSCACRSSRGSLRLEGLV